MKPHIFRTALACLLIAGSLAACDVQSFDDAAAGIVTAPPPPPPPPPPPAGFGPNFSEIQASVFTPTCATASCHSGAGPSGGLNLEAANSYAMLVGVVSNEDPVFMRVDPFNPDDSYLIRKLEGNAGGVMPPGAPLPRADIDVIRQWISDGAIDDRLPASTPIRVASLNPMPNAVLTAAPTQIIAGFNRDPDPATVNAMTFILTASGNDGTFGEANDLQIAAASITVPAANQQTAVFDLGAVVLADDTYRVTLSGSPPSMIMDMDASALDGEYLGVFPSGNGTAGGDFQADFVINTPVVIGPTLN